MKYPSKTTPDHKGLRADEPLNVLSPTISKKVEHVLGQRLRAAFSDVFEEPLPQRFIELLDELARKSQQ